jgi:hypothetical protein
MASVLVVIRRVDLILAITALSGFSMTFTVSLKGL